MRPTTLKRKQEKDHSVRALEPYKKRLVCEFGGLELEEAPRYVEKKIYQGEIKETLTDCLGKEPFLANKPWKLSWAGKVEQHISRLIRPDLILEQVMSFYEKDRFALVLYDEKRVQSWPMISRQEGRPVDSRGKSDEKIENFKCSEQFHRFQPEFLQSTAIEIE